ncbi:MAG TPA: GNAT family protein [Frateuria sp.]|uniref:GNAT family N-acetyltransferase n=1 Tax=Frateuria sp. TaxID=2211372 RepID=UPI002D7F3826|nr:GNAT family protein [Frateuria sp.]HET6806797.1 GNAT family protein [Frateuria sp.]
MELVTARLLLDRLCPEDAEALFACRADPAVARFQGWRPASVAEARAFIEAQAEPAPGLWFQRAIRRRDDHALIGDLGVCLPATRGDSVEFGISLAPLHQGRGHAREVLQAVFQQGFDVLGWRRIHASVDPRNTACIALLRALGMRQEAHFRESLWLHGEWVDDAVFAILAREWQATAAPR